MKRYRAEENAATLAGRVLREGVGLPAMIAHTSNMADAEMIARALNNEGAVKAAEASEQALMDALSLMSPDLGARFIRTTTYARAASALREMRGQ